MVVYTGGKMIAVTCRTPIHIFRTIQLKMTNWCNEKVDVFVFDSFANSEKVAKRMQDTNLFENIYYIKDSEVAVKGRLSGIRSHYKNSYFKRKLEDKFYSELYVFNIYGIFTDIAFNVLKRKNANLKYHVIEDGPSIYHIKKELTKSEKYVYPLFGLKSAQNNVDYWWFSKPETMSVFGKGKKRKLPVVSREDTALVETINKVFDYRMDAQLINANVIFMEECYFVDGLMTTNADLSLFKLIKENHPDLKFVVKMHPRSKVDRFSNDFYVLPMDGIPWEVYLLNYNMTNKILISISCSTMISSTLLFGDELRSIVLFEFVKDYVIEKATGESYFTKARIKKLISQKGLYKNKKLFCIATSMKDIDEYLSTQLYY